MSLSRDGNSTNKGLEVSVLVLRIAARKSSGDPGVRPVRIPVIA